MFVYCEKLVIYVFLPWLAVIFTAFSGKVAQRYVFSLYIQIHLRIGCTGRAKICAFGFAQSIRWIYIDQGTTSHPRQWRFPASGGLHGMDDFAGDRSRVRVHKGTVPTEMDQ
jgi:hypothetical protein